MSDPKRTSHSSAPSQSAAKSGFSSIPVSPLLRMATAGSLAAESFLPSVARAGLPAAQGAIGYFQRTTALAGMAYYGKKAYQEGGLGNMGMFAGYTAFGAHGYLRMSEAMKPHAPRTAASGALAAGLKLASSEPASAAGYAADMFANVAEYGHSVQSPKSGGFRAALSIVAHQVTPRRLARTQRLGAAVLAAEAGHKIFKKFQSQSKT